MSDRIKPRLRPGVEAVEGRVLAAADVMSAAAAQVPAPVAARATAAASDVVDSSGHGDQVEKNEHGQYYYWDFREHHDHTDGSHHHTFDLHAYNRATGQRGTVLGRVQVATKGRGTSNAFDPGAHGNQVVDDDRGRSFLWDFREHHDHTDGSHHHTFDLYAYNRATGQRGESLGRHQFDIPMSALDRTKNGIEQGFRNSGRDDLAGMARTDDFHAWVNKESGWNPRAVSPPNNQGLRNDGLFQIWRGHAFNRNGEVSRMSPYDQARTVARSFPQLSPARIRQYAAQIRMGTYKGWG